MASSSSSRQTTSSSNSEVITNQVDGNGDNNINTDLANSDGNTINITETDQGAVNAAFDFGVKALDSVQASVNAANEFADGALDAASDSIRDQGAVNSEKIVKTVVAGAVILALGIFGIKAVK